MVTVINFQTFAKLPELSAKGHQLLEPLFDQINCSQQNNQSLMPECLLGDNIRLKQVLINLTRNAL